MSTPIKLKELIDEMQCQIEEYTQYFNKKTGEFVSVSDDEFRAAEEDEDNENIINIEEDGVQIAVDILENSDDYSELPSKYDIDEYDIMERFCLSIENNKNRNALSNAMKGSGAFGRFKDMIGELGIEDDWYHFKDEEYKKIAIEWCNDNGIKFE
jgi:hypothetical protein